LAAAWLALFVVGQPALAQPPCPPSADDSYQGEMRFTVRERQGQNPVLIAEGIIDQNTVPRLQAALDSFRGEEIWLRSPGGYVGADREAGRLIRARGLSTRIPSGWTCRGGCNFMFMGGVERTVEPGGHFIVRMFAHTGDVGNFVEVAGSSRAIATEDHGFLLRMGVSRRLLDEVMYRQPARGDAPERCMTAAELDRYNVTTPRAGRPR
jgi:hypothetical protein